MKCSVNYYLLVTVFFMQSTTLFAQQRTDTFSIWFPTNGSNLTKSNTAYLDSINRTSIEGKNIKISIRGWADFTGNNVSNILLSANRAEVVKTYLLNHNVDVKKMDTVYGAGIGDRFGGKDEQRQTQIIIHSRNNIPSFDSIQKSPINTKFELTDLVFYEMRAIMLPSSFSTLKALFAALERYKNIKVKIIGHICCRNSGLPETKNEFGWKLSIERAKVVYDYLVARGIDATRLSFEGVGFSAPKVFPELSNDDQKRNRIVEVEITGK